MRNYNGALYLKYIAKRYFRSPFIIDIIKNLCNYYNIMSDQVSYMNTHAQKITELKKMYSDKTKNNNQTDTKNILREMRIIHGCAIYDNFDDIMNIYKKNGKGTTDEDWIKLSANASFLHIMHHHIRHCEKMSYIKDHHIGRSNNDDIFSTDSESQYTQSPQQTQYTKSKIVPVFNRVSANTEELSLKNIQSDLNSENTPAILFRKKIEQAAQDIDIMAGGDRLTEFDTTEYVNNIGTTEADDLEVEYDIEYDDGNNTGNNMTGGFDTSKPTVVLYWGDWCPPSRRFKPTWDKFEEFSKKNLPNIQVTDINVRKDDKKAIELASAVGVNSYPTIVFFHNGKKHHKPAGPMSVDDISNFIKNISGQ